MKSNGEHSAVLQDRTVLQGGQDRLRKLQLELFRVGGDGSPRPHRQPVAHRRSCCQPQRHLVLSQQDPGCAQRLLAALVQTCRGAAGDSRSVGAARPGRTRVPRVPRRRDAVQSNILRLRLRTLTSGCPCCHIRRGHQVSAALDQPSRRPLNDRRQPVSRRLCRCARGLEHHLARSLHNAIHCPCAVAGTFNQRCSWSAGLRSQTWGECLLHLPTGAASSQLGRRRSMTHCQFKMARSPQCGHSTQVAGSTVTGI